MQYTISYADSGCVKHIIGTANSYKQAEIYINLYIKSEDDKKLYIIEPTK